MISRAVKKAREMYRKYHCSEFPLDIEKIVVAEGCELIAWYFLPPVKEVKRGRYIGIALGLDHREQRYLIAHALTHHLLHCGNQLAFHDLQKVALSEQEREADECAAHILIPEQELAKVKHLTRCELAEYFGVPEHLVQLRMTEFATKTELKNWQKGDLFDTRTKETN
jgi:Zn-dependent peptidase ImmA (M78 family)